MLPQSLQCCRFLPESFFNNIVKLALNLALELLDHIVLLQGHLGVLCQEYLAETTGSQGLYNLIATIDKLMLII